MKKLLVAVIGVIGVAGAVFFITREPDVVVADPDCAGDEFVMALTVNVPGIAHIRQTEVAGMRSDGTVEVIVKDEASWDAEFSSDGSQLVFVSGREGFHDECCGYSEQALYVVNSDGSNERRLFEEDSGPVDLNPMPFGETISDNAPTWSPTRDEIAFARGMGRGSSIMLTDPDGAEPREVHAVDAEVTDLVWSPDGERLAYVWGDRESIWVVDRDGSNAEPLSEDLGGVESLSWSSDGETLVFRSGVGVYTITTKKPNPRLLLRKGWSPMFSPDGSHIVYKAEGDNFETWLEVQPVDGGTAERLPVGLPKKRGIESISDWLSCS